MLRQSGAQLFSYLRASLPATQMNSSAAFGTRTQPCDVPSGHMNSDLRDVACNIGLGRRRDLTLRQDLCLWRDGEKLSLSDVMKGRNIMLVGFPGGPVCTEHQLPGYVQMADTLSKRGVDKVVAVTVAEPQAVKELSEKEKLKCTKLELLSDRTGAFMRLLGLEIIPSDPSQPGPKCQRFAGIVEDGILVKLCIEEHPKDLKVSDAGSMLKLWEKVYVH